jgi:hypothetical protein
MMPHQAALSSATPAIPTSLLQERADGALGAIDVALGEIVVGAKNLGRKRLDLSRHPLRVSRQIMSAGSRQAVGVFVPALDQRYIQGKS